MTPIAMVTRVIQRSGRWTNPKALPVRIIANRLGSRVNSCPRR
jgi:hypothetical protein